MQETTSLDRLHDIVLPEPVSWWPLAPGWFALLAVSILAAAWCITVTLRRWRAGAYRRAALRALEGATDVRSVAEVLRRTALAVAPRSEVTRRSGDEWVDWLARRVDGEIPDTVRAQLAVGAYAAEPSPGVPAALRNFAETWIRDHRRNGPGVAR